MGVVFTQTQTHENHPTVQVLISGVSQPGDETAATPLTPVEESVFMLEAQLRLHLVLRQSAAHRPPYVQCNVA